jgi:hypothetical protein
MSGGIAGRMGLHATRWRHAAPTHLGEYPRASARGSQQGFRAGASRHHRLGGFRRLMFLAVDG